MNIITSLVYVFVYIAVYLAADILISFTGSLGIIPQISQLIFYAAVLAVFSVLTHGSRLNIGKGFSIEKFRFSTVLTGILLTAGLHLISSGITALPYLQQYIPEYEGTLHHIFKGEGSAFLITLCIAAPAFEEIMFRGVILGELKQSMPFHVANVLQAVSFALMHGNIMQGIYTFVIALFLGLFYKKAGNIYAPIAVHILFNTLNVYIAYFGISLPFEGIIHLSVGIVLSVLALCFTKSGYGKGRRRA